MPDTDRCVGCGAEIPAGISSDGLCPACLLKLGAGRTGTHEPADDDPTISALTHHHPGSGRNRMIPAGQQFGPYRVERLLGKGGMGEVYEAEDESGRRVALKVLTHGLDNPSDRARFLREGRLAASISHPHTVYVYGTDEIEGVPVITMEMATGGTLKDRVKEHGPLRAAEAVDVILQVIAGLEAAAAGGVLHRDVKPSNCFIDSEGRIKVGDFGLSISTLARAERDLTMTGTFLGTPAFASPEQLRGDDLDVRSDIYSIGATLYYLVTGRLPFEETNVIKLATMIAQDPPRPLTELRPDVAPGLATVVMHCLAKRRDDRIPTYAALTKELEPFSSTAPKPAPVGLRVAAGVIDWLAVGVLLTPVTIYLRWVALTPLAGSTAFFHQLAYVVFTAAYFVVLESRWGTSVGKALCGLRVAGPDSLTPSLGRALLRGLVFAVAIRLVNLVAPEGAASPYLGVDTQVSVGLGVNLGFVVGGLNPSRWEAADFWYLGIALLFLTARRRNGFAGLHELSSDTRVVMSSPVEVRPTARSTSDVVGPQVTADRIGPYQVLKRLNGGLVLGYDGRLRRKVWIHLLPPGAPALLPHRRDLSRPGRLHWLTGRRSAEECWDAYEAVEGEPLVALLSVPQPWSKVRHWLRDLRAELSAGVEDQTIPDLALDRVWITSDQRAKLLDWQAPGVEGQRDTSRVTGPAPPDARSAQRFLNSMAASALHGRVVHHEAAADLPVVPLPLSARRFLKQLGRQTFQTLEQLGPVLETLVAGPAFVSHRKRWLHLAFFGVVPAVAWTVVPPALLAIRWANQHPTLMELPICINQLELLERRISAGPPLQPEELERIGFDTADVQRIVWALETHVAGQFLTMGVDPSTWEQPFIQPNWRTVAGRAAAAHPSPSRRELDEAADIVRPFLATQMAESWLSPEAREGIQPVLTAQVLGFLLILFLFSSATLGLLTAALFRGGLLLRMLGVGVVTTAGSEASRVQALARAAVGWLPLLPAGIAEVLSMRNDYLGRSDADLSAWWFVVLVPWLAGVVWAAYDPQRGLQDRLAGTHLVPR